MVYDSEVDDSQSSPHCIVLIKAMYLCNYIALVLITQNLELQLQVRFR